MNILSGVRNHRKVRPHYTALERRGFPSQPALRFAQGYLALSAYPAILSESGQQLLAEANTLMTSPTPASHEPTANQFDALLPQFPSVASPKLSQLYVSPDSAVKAAIDRYISLYPIDKLKMIIEITSGCYNQCFDCALDAPPKENHMPYPMALVIAEEILLPMTSKYGAIKIQPYFRSDPMHYADKYWDADFADFAIRVVAEMGLNVDIITHGWARGDKYAGQAAEKLFEAGIRAGDLSVHLLHKQLERNPDRVEDYVERFRLARKLLQPKNFRLKGNFPEMEGPEVFSGDFILELFEKIIAPGWSKPFGNWSDIPYYEGRARSVKGAYEYYRRVSIVSHPNFFVRFAPDGGCVLEKSVKRYPNKKEEAATVEQIFSGPDDPRFKSFIYLLASLHHLPARVRGSLLALEIDKKMLKYLQAGLTPLYGDDLNDLSRFVGYAPEFDEWLFEELENHDLCVLFEHFKGMLLAVRDFPRGLSIGEIIEKYWESNKDKYPQFDDNFYRFFLECLNIIEYGKSEVLKEEDAAALNSVFNKRRWLRMIIGVRSFREGVRNLLSNEQTEETTLEKARELFVLIKDRLSYYYGFWLSPNPEYPKRVNCSWNPIIDEVVMVTEIQPTEPASRLFPNPF